MAGASRSGIILVVDDVDSVRAIIRRELADAGHTILEAGDGAEALHLVRRRNGAIDLILSDMLMPEMTGVELATRVGGEFPAVPVILMSAFAPAGSVHVDLGETLVPILQKPFEPGQLVALVAVVLDHPAAQRSERPARAF